MLEIPTAHKQAAEQYDKTLREMKRRGIKVEHLSDEVAESMLALHQNALVVWMAEKENKRLAVIGGD